MNDVKAEPSPVQTCMDIPGISHEIPTTADWRKDQWHRDHKVQQLQQISQHQTVNILLNKKHHIHKPVYHKLLQKWQDKCTTLCQ